MSDQLPTRFAFDPMGLRAPFARALETDRKRARLSPAFRAYYAVRSLIPLSVRQLLQHHRQIDAPPRWYYCDSFHAALVQVVDQEREVVRVIHPWPDGAQFAFVPTHDVETADGMRNLLPIADLEQELGFRSVWNIVPHKYPIDRGIIRELIDRGFEIGIHGYNHDGKLFTSRRVFNSRVRPINDALQAFHAVGFRAPMVHRNLEWLQSLDIEYDASCFDVDPFQAMPGGVGAPWPFIAGKFVELPYTLPQDHTLFIALAERNERIWIEKLDYIRAMHGMALVITHPDYLDSLSRVEAYRQLLLRVRECDCAWQALPRDIAAWWRDRDQSNLSRTADGEWRVDGPASDRARVATLGARRASDLSTELEWRILPVAKSQPSIQPLLAQ